MSIDVNKKMINLCWCCKLNFLIKKHSQADTALRGVGGGGVGGDTPIYGPYRYELRYRIGFLGSWSLNSIVYPVSSLVWEIAQLNEKQMIC